MPIKFDITVGFWGEQSHLPDGSPFQPILRRQHTHDTRATPTEIKFGEPSDLSSSRRRPSLVVQTHGLE